MHQHNLGTFHDVAEMLLIWHETASFITFKVKIGFQMFNKYREFTLKKVLHFHKIPNISETVNCDK